MISVDVVHSFLRKKETGNMNRCQPAAFWQLKKEAPVS